MPSTTLNTSGTTTITISVAATARTPVWKRFRMSPPGRQSLLLVSVGLILLTILLTVSRYASVSKIPTCAAASVLLFAIAIGAISCGGGAGSDPGSGGGAPLSLTCNLGSATISALYSNACVSSGGTGALRFSISAGALPPGLALNLYNGLIIGTPTTSGISSFTLKVTDSGSPVQTATQAVTNFIVAGGPLSLQCSNLASGPVAKAYKDSCFTNGGTPPFAYSIVAGALPPGLTLNSSTGTLTGVPTTAGNYSFTESVTDSGSPGQTATSAEQLAVVPLSPFIMYCPMGATAYLGTPYSGECALIGGNYPYTVSIVSGALPPGVSFGSGQFSGTPTAIGTYSFTVQALDGSSPPQSLQSNASVVVGPHGTESGVVTITATSGGIVNTTTISVTVP